MVYTYIITIPLKFQGRTIQDDRLHSSREMNFVVDFTSKTLLTHTDVQRAEAALKDFLKGKPVTADTELLRCVTKIAASCMAEAKPMLERLSALRPNFPKVQPGVVLNGHLSCEEKQ